MDLKHYVSAFVKRNCVSERKEIVLYSEILNIASHTVVSYIVAMCRRHHCHNLHRVQFRLVGDSPDDVHHLLLLEIQTTQEKDRTEG